MEKKPSIWQREISLSDSGLFAALPPDAAQWAAAICAGTFIVSPLIVSIPCLIHHSFDYTVYTHPAIVRGLTWPVAALSGAVALILACCQGFRAGWRPLPWLRKNPVFLCFGALVLWMLLSTAVNGPEFLFAVDNQHLIFESFFMQLGYFLILFPTAALLRDRQIRLWLVRLHEAVSLLLVPVALFLWRTQIDSVMFYDWTPSVTAVFSNINYYGYYLAVAIPLAAAMFVSERRWGWKAFSGVTVAANTVVLALNDTMGAWVACAAAMVFLLIAHGVLERKINRQAVLIALLFAVCLFLPGHLLGSFEKNVSTLGHDVLKIAAGDEDAGHAGSGRWIIWQRSLTLIGEHPLFGLGFEGVHVRGMREYARNTRPHNEFMQYALFYGIPAGIAYLAGTAGIYLRAVRRRQVLSPLSLVCLTGAFGYLASSCFGLTLFSTAPYLFLFLGMGYRLEEV